MWTADALASEIAPYAGAVWRVVESQHRVSTMRITDTLEEQQLLEALIEEVKPVMPAECAGLDYLLATPFCYSPYPMGSRFRRSGQREGAFYAAERVGTALAEMAFYRLLFFADSPQTILPSVPAGLTAIRLQVLTRMAIDLTRGGLSVDGEAWRHPFDYGPCQELADLARNIGVELLRSHSVRDPRGGANITLLSPKAFARSKPTAQQAWRMLIQPTGVRVWRDGAGGEEFEFTPEDFAADPRLPRAV